MRGDAEQQTEMLLALTPDQLVPDDHPIRRIKLVVERVLARLSPRFNAMYAERGRPSIPPEHLLKASLLIALYSLRSERQFCERLRYDLLFKWFLDLNVADRGFDASSFSKNRERLLAHDVARAFPNLRLLVAHTGFPWVDECLVLGSRHRNVWMDISFFNSTMTRRQTYEFLQRARQIGCPWTRICWATCCRNAPKAGQSKRMK